MVCKRRWRSRRIVLVWWQVVKGAFFSNALEVFYILDFFGVSADQIKDNGKDGTKETAEVPVLNLASNLADKLQKDNGHKQVHAFDLGAVYQVLTG